MVDKPCSYLKEEEIDGKICRYVFVLFQFQLKFFKKEERNRGREEEKEGRKAEL